MSCILVQSNFMLQNKTKGNYKRNGDYLIFRRLPTNLYYFKKWMRIKKNERSYDGKDNFPSHGTPFFIGDQKI